MSYQPWTARAALRAVPTSASVLDTLGRVVWPGTNGTITLPAGAWRPRAGSLFPDG